MELTYLVNSRRIETSLGNDNQLEMGSRDIARNDSEEGLFPHSLPRGEGEMAAVEYRVRRLLGSEKTQRKGHRRSSPLFFLGCNYKKILRR